MLFERMFTGILAVWRTNKGRNMWVTFIFVTALLAICAGVAWIGAVPTFIDGHDNFFLLENGWRALQGLRPHIDFWSPWGPLTFLVVALGLKLGHLSSNGLAYGSAMFAALVGLWTYQVCRARLAPVPGAFLALYNTILACSPHPIGSSLMSLSPAMVYNRYGYALLVIILVECFQSFHESKAGSQEWLGGASTGAALSLTLFLKASYFLAGLGLVGVSFLLWSPSQRRFAGLVTGFSAVTVVGLAYLRFELAAMLRGLRLAAAARSQSLSMETPIHTIAGQMVPLLCGFSLAVAASFLKPRWPEKLAELHLPLTAMIISIADIALLATNMQPSGLPLLAAFGILVANRLADPEFHSSAVGRQLALPFYASVLLLAGLLIWPQLAIDALALPAAALLKSHPPASCAVRFTEPRIADLLLCDRPDLNPALKRSNGSTYTKYVNDGTTLLRKYCKSSDKILTIDMQNPFPYVLGWQPPRGGLASTSFNYTVSDKFRPSIDDYFGDASVVMLPRHPAQNPEFLDKFDEIYGREVEQRFALEAESDWFRLYKRK
jgi:hypothetical protein